MLMFRRRFVLLVGDDGVLLTGGDAPALFAASSDNPARKNIHARLAEYPNAAVTVLYNGTRQEFRFETLPPLGLVDRWKLVRRRLRQAFPKAYAATGRAKGGHVLLAAIQPNLPLSEWVEALTTPFATLGLLPAEAAALLQRLEPEAKKGWAMLLARFRTGGLRQIVTCDGGLAFTRLVPDAALAQMIDDSRGYLARFGLTEDTPLRVVALTEKTDSIAGITTMTPQQAAKACGFSIPDDEGDEADRLFAEFIAHRRGLCLSLAPRAALRRKQQAVMAWAGWRAAVAVSVLAVLLTGWSCANLVAQLYANHRDAGAVDDLRRRIIAEETAMAPVGQPLDRLRAALERQRLFNESQSDPWNVMKKLAASFDGKAFAASMEWNDSGEMRLTLRLTLGQNGPEDRESIVKDFRGLAAQAAHDLPDYDVALTRYPFPAMSRDILTNAASAATTATDRPEAEMTIRKRP